MQLLCLGDIAISDKDMPPWEPPGDIHPGEETKVLFNWELPISDRINPVPRSSGPRLVAHPESWRAIHKWAPGIAALANNHIFDAGEGGLIKTLEILNKAGFTTVGAGQNKEEIRKPLIWETTEGRLAILNWVFPETHPDWLSIPGPRCWPGLDQAREEIRELKTVADWVMVVAHWSDEHFSYPRPADRTVALELARMGVDVIVGHHPHVVRGMERIGHCPVFYSIGNFFFSDLSDSLHVWGMGKAPRNKEGLGIVLSFCSGKNPGYKIVSFWQADRRTIVDPARRAFRRMEWSSRPLLRYSGAGYAERYARQRAWFDRWGARWHFGFRRLGIRGTIMQVFKKYLLSSIRGTPAEKGID